MSNNPTKVVTGKVRASFAQVFEPKAMQEGAQEKYSISLLIDKNDKDTLNKVEAAILAAFNAGNDSGKFGKKFKSKDEVPPNFKWPLRDGDDEKPDDANYENKMFLNAASTNKPQIVDKDLNPIMSKEGFYSGCFCRASVNFYPFNASGNKGIAAGLQNLQFLEDGERLAGSSSAADDFGKEDDDDLMGGN